MIPSPATTTLDVASLRTQFPALARTVHGRPLVYLDNAATTHKPQSVIDRVSRFYAHENANVHRGVHLLSQEATDAYEGVRPLIRAYLNAERTEEIVFTRGTTDGINLVASCLSDGYLKEGDEILLTGMEHHSNIVPWQLAAERSGARIRVVPVTERGEMDYEAFQRLLGGRTAIVAVAHVSNALGTVNPIRRIVADAHGMGVPVLVDGAQAVPHGPVDVRELGCDFYCFSAHKAFGPTGTGALYAKAEWLERMPPYQGGGDMIASVSFDRTTYADIPHKFEAGTPNIAGVVGMGAALEYLDALPFGAVKAHEAELVAYAHERLAAVPGMRFVGTAADKVSVVSFLVGTVHPYDLATVMDRHGVAVRTGHHCAQPLMERFGIPGTVRASFAHYNLRDEVDRLAEAVETAAGMLA